MNVKNMSLQIPSTGEHLHTPLALVSTDTGMCQHVPFKVTGGQTAFPTDLTPVRVVAAVGRLVHLQELHSRELLTTLRTRVSTRCLDDRARATECCSLQTQTHTVG